MFQLVTLGAADLLGANGHRINSVVQQPKRYLLLAYLALASRDAPVRRDALLPLFWPESDDAHARHSLKQSIYFLRRSLGPTAAVVDGQDNLRIDFGVLTCDVHGLEAAVAEGEHRRALDLYGGDFLPGMFVDGSGEFESWLEGRRARCRELAIEAARGLARAERSRGNAAGAAHGGRRLAELAGRNEPLLLEAMGVLVESGDRPGAAEVYASFERRLRTELEIGPSGEMRSLAQRLLAGGRGGNGGNGVARAGARPAIAVPPPATSAGTPSSADPVAAGPADAGRARVAGEDEAAGPKVVHGRIRGRDIAALLVVLALALLASWHGSSGGPPPGESRAAPIAAAITVLDFEHSGGDGQAAAVAHALPVVARRELAGVRGLVVLSPAGPQPALAGAASVRDRERPVAETFEVGGAVRVTDGEVRVELALWEPASGRLIRAFSLRHPATEVEAAAESLGRRIASTVRTEVGRERRARASRAVTPDPRAWEAVQLAEELVREARDLRRRGQVETAAAGLLQADSLLASAEAPALPWTGPSVTRARVAAERAWMAFMPPVADRALARTEFERALAHATRAVSRSPDDPSAREMRGTIAYWMWETLDLDESRSRELLGSAEADLRRAIRSDPARIRAWSLLGDMAYRQADFTGAFWATKQAYELDTYHEHAHELLARLFANAYELGDDAGAERWCAELRQHFPGSPTGAHCAIAGKAYRDRHEPTDADAAWTTIRELNASRSAAIIVPRLEMMVASILAGAGLPDSADAVIDRARKRGQPDPELLHLEAHARALLGQPDAAAALLGDYVAADPARRSHVARSRRFEALGN